MGASPTGFPAPAVGGHLAGSVEASNIKGRQLRVFRRQVQMIFQDPYESMNPRRTVYDTIAEPLAVQGIGHVQDRLDRVSEILNLVGLTPAGAFFVPPAARAVGRTASTGGDCSRAGDRAVVRGGRRAHVHAGRVEPDGDHVR